MRPGSLQLTSFAAVAAVRAPALVPAQMPVPRFQSAPGARRRTPLARGARYTAALVADLEAALPPVWGRTVQTIFIGGGTPSLFQPAVHRPAAERHTRAPAVEARRTARSRWRPTRCTFRERTLAPGDRRRGRDAPVHRRAKLQRPAPAGSGPRARPRPGPGCRGRGRAGVLRPSTSMTRTPCPARRRPSRSRTCARPRHWRRLTSPSTT